MYNFYGIIDKNFAKKYNYETEIKTVLKNSIENNPVYQNFHFNNDFGLYLGIVSSEKLDSDATPQIYTSKDKKYVILFCGKIYNCNELKSSFLKNINIPKNTTSEILLNLYFTMGIDFVKNLDGKFSFCIIDCVEKKVFLVRDRLGIKPLYYCEFGDLICFFSSLKIMPHFINKNLENKALFLYFKLRYIPAPYTIYQNVFKLKAGELVCFSLDIQPQHKQYYPYNNIFKTNEFNLEEFKCILTDAIFSTFKEHSGPSGLFLSGGIDSGIIATILGNRIKTFSLEYCENSTNSEYPIVDEIVQELHLNANVKVVPDDIQSAINNMIQLIDEPVYSSVLLGTYTLSKVSSKYVKNIFTGDGSDELVFGYKYLRDSLKEKDVYNSYTSAVGWLKFSETKDWLFSTPFSDEEFMHFLFDDCIVDGNVAETLRRFELFKRFPDYHMTRLNALTVFSENDIAIPFLRNAYCNHVLSLDRDIFLKNDDVKLVLKNAFCDSLPNALFTTTKKPFYAPIKDWIEKDLKSDVMFLFNNKPLIEKMQLNYYKVLDLLNNYTGDYADVSNVWGIYMLLKWGYLNINNV